MTKVAMRVVMVIMTAIMAVGGMDMTVVVTVVMATVTVPLM